MTEQTTNLGRCKMGAATDTPCTRPDVEPLAYELPESIRDEVGDVGGICRFHLAMEPMWAEVDELAIALETVDAWKKAAERRGNEYLVRITFQAHADLSERLEFLEGNLEAIKKADMGLR